MKISNSKLTKNSQTLRKNMTKEERHLWYDFLKALPVTIKRQKTIGNYIVDFYCASAQLVIELDGSQHFEDTGMASDMERDAYLRYLGLTVLRYSNRQINQQFREVCEDILNHLPPHQSASLTASPQGEAFEDCNNYREELRL